MQKSGRPEYPLIEGKTRRKHDENGGDAWPFRLYPVRRDLARQLCGLNVTAARCLFLSVQHLSQGLPSSPEISCAT